MTPQFFDLGYETRSRLRNFEREVFLTVAGIEYGVWIDAQIRLYENNDNMPAIERIWPVSAFDGAGHTVCDPELLKWLQEAARAWCEQEIDTILEEIERKAKE